MSKTGKGHPRPSPYRWTPDFVTMYAKIDDQHKVLFDAIFNLAAYGGMKPVQDCYEVTYGHFRDEEATMKANKYSDFDSHKAKHDGFLSTLKGISVAEGAKVTPKQLEEVQDWLCDHIKEVDWKYKGKLSVQ